MTKISELTSLVTPDAADELAIVDTSAAATRKVTASGVVSGGSPVSTTAGTAAAFTLALPNSLTNTAGQSFKVRFHLAPDAAATISIDGQTALALRLYDGAGALTALAAGDVAIDSIVTLTLIDDGGTLRAVVNRDRTLLSPLSKEYTSPETAITSASTATLTHGLGEIPRLVTYELVCQNTDAGYTAGDVVDVAPNAATSSTGSVGFTVVRTSTDLVLRIASSGVIILRKDTGAGAVVTNTNWRIRLRAWA